MTRGRALNCFFSPPTGREQAKKHDPLPGLLARKPTTAAAAPAAPEPVFAGRDDYGDEAEAHESADEGEKAKQTTASAKRQYAPYLSAVSWTVYVCRVCGLCASVRLTASYRYNERHPSATRLKWDSEDGTCHPRAPSWSFSYECRVCRVCRVCCHDCVCTQSRSRRATSRR